MLLLFLIGKDRRVVEIYEHFIKREKTGLNKTLASGVLNHSTHCKKFAIYELRGSQLYFSPSCLSWN